MKKVLGTLFVAGLLFSARGFASGCGPGLQADVREKVSEVQTQGVFTCSGPETDSSSERCELVVDDAAVPALSYNWVENSDLPVQGKAMAVTVEVHNALMFDECYGPGLEEESNAYYYITYVNGVRYANFKYK